MRILRVAPRWFCVLFIVLGLYVLGVSLDVVPYAPPTRKRGLFDSPHHWQISSVGIAFVAAGVLLALPRARTTWRLLLGLPTAGGLFAPLLWLIFGSSLPPGDRALLAIPTAMGLAGMALGVYQAFTGRPFDPYSLDPLEAARVLRQHGRPEQAEAVLRRALVEEPGRQAELRRAIDAMKHKRQS